METIKTSIALVTDFEGWKEVIRTFSVEDGRKVILRMPKWEDLDGSLELINSPVAERGEIIRDEKVSREVEIDWLSKVLASLEKEEIFFLAP